MIALCFICFCAGMATGCWLTAIWLVSKPTASPPTEPVVRYVHGQLPVVIKPPKAESKPDEPKP